MGKGNKSGKNKGKKTKRKIQMKGGQIKWNLPEHKKVNFQDC